MHVLFGAAAGAWYLLAVRRREARKGQPVLHARLPDSGPSVGAFRELLRRKHEEARCRLFDCRGTDRCDGCRHLVVKPAAARPPARRVRVLTPGMGSPYIDAKWRPKAPKQHSVDWPMLTFTISQPALPEDFVDASRLREGMRVGERVAFWVALEGYARVHATR